MIDRVGLHRPHHADFVGDLADMRHQFAHLDARLAIGLKLVFRTEQRGIRIDERRPIALQEVGRRQFAIVLGEFRLPVEQFEVARGKHVDDPLRPRGIVRLFHGEGRRRRDSRPRLAGREGPGGDARQADAAVAEKPTTGKEPRPGGVNQVQIGIHHGRPHVSSW